jgi:hypothetical protein
MLAYEVMVAHETAHKQGGKPYILPLRVNYFEVLPEQLAIIIGSLRPALWTSPRDDQHVVQEVIQTLSVLFDHNPV